MDVIIELIDRKEYDKIKFSNKPYEHIIKEMNDNNIEIKYSLIFEALNTEEPIILHRFGPTGLPWSVFENIAFEEYNYIDIKSEWLTIDRLEGLTDFNIYYQLLKGCLYHRYDLPECFINHYREINDNQLFFKLLENGRRLDYERGKYFYETFLKYSKIIDFVILDDFEKAWNYDEEDLRYLNTFDIDENVSDDMTLNEKVKQIMINMNNHFLDDTNFYFKLQMQYIGMHFHNLDIENKTSYLNNIKKWFSKEDIFIILNDSNNNELFDVMCDEINIIDIVKKIYHTQGIYAHLARKIISIDNSLIDYLIISEIDYLYQNSLLCEITASDIIRTVDRIVNTDDFPEIKK